MLASEFTSLSAENQMKWDHLRPAPDTYDFTDADAIADFAEANGQVVRGHTLMWHSQNPDWIEQGDHTPGAAARDPEGPHLHGGRSLRGPHAAVGRRQ